MKLPWVSRRAYELLEGQLDRVIAERDAYREQADRAKDELISRLGCEPVSAPVRSEMKEARQEVEKYIEQFECDDSGGMIDPDIMRVVDDVVNSAKKPAN